MQVCNPAGTGVLTGSCQRWKHKLATGLESSRASAGINATHRLNSNLNPWVKHTTFQNILVTKLSQWNEHNISRGKL